MSHNKQDSNKDLKRFTLCVKHVEMNESNFSTIYIFSEMYLYFMFYIRRDFRGVCYVDRKFKK